MTPSQKSALQFCLIILKYFLLCWLPLVVLCGIARAYIDDPNLFTFSIERSYEEWEYMITVVLFFVFFMLVPIYLIALLCFYIRSSVMTVKSFLWRSLVMSLWFSPILLLPLFSGHAEFGMDFLRAVMDMFVISALPSLLFVWLTQRRLRATLNYHNQL